MKLLRYGERGKERPALLDDRARIRDLGRVVSDIGGDTLTRKGLQRIRDLNVNELPIVDGDPRIGACIADCGKLICVGLNYADHARESGMLLPTEPVIFMKATSSICGPYDDVVIPPGASKVDWEVELGVVIGERAAYVSEEAAVECIAGYCIVHDVSERAFQLEGTGQWVKGKSADSFGPLGPWLVTRDELTNPRVLDIWLEVNGDRMQNSNTSNMVVGPAKLVSYVSRYMSLQPGDIISTGTPPGVGLGRSPPRYLAPEDRIVLGIQGLGVQVQTVRAHQLPASRHG